MIYVVNINDNQLLNKCDGWELGGEKRMSDWATENGYSIQNTEITLMGNMIIWVS